MAYRVLPLLLLVGCGPAVVPADSNGEETETADTQTSDSTGNDGTGPDVTTNADSSGSGSSGEVETVEWCVVRNELPDHSSGAHLYIIDVDGDGRSEILRTRDDNLQVFRVDGFEEAPTVLFDVTRPGDRWTFWDVDGDAWIDAVLLSKSFDPIAWYAGNPRNGFSERSQAFIPPPGYIIDAVVDISGDGLPDIISRPGVYTYFFVSFGDGTGSFAPVSEHNFDPAGMYPTTEVDTLGDWSWFLLRSELRCRTCTGSSIVLASLDAEGTMAEHQRLEDFWAREVFRYGLHNDDDQPDVLVSAGFQEGQGATELVWLNSTAGGELEVEPLLQDLNRPEVFHVDMDGQAELLLDPLEEPPTLRVWDNGTYGPAAPITGELGRSSFGAPGDLNGDGWMDYIGSLSAKNGTVIGEEIWSLRPCEGE